MRRRPSPSDSRAVMHEAIVQSGLQSAARAEELGPRPRSHRDLGQMFGSAGSDRRLSHARGALRLCACISASPKRAWDRRASSPRRRHLSVLLQEGIGDTIRISLTPDPGGDRTPRGHRRAGNSAEHGASLVCAADHRVPRLRAHDVDGVPGTRPGCRGLCARPHARMAQVLCRASRRCSLR